MKRVSLRVRAQTLKPRTELESWGRIGLIIAAIFLLAAALPAAGADGQDKPQVFEDNANKATLEDRLRKAYDEFQKKNATQLAAAADTKGGADKTTSKKTKGAKGEDVEFKEMLLANQSRIKELFSMAEACFKEGKFRDAASYYASVAMANVPKTEQMVEDARKRFIEMEGLAEEHLKLAMDCDLKRDFLKEVEELSIITREFPFTKSNETAKPRLVALKTRPDVAAHVELAEADAAQAAGNLTQAVKLYQAILDNPRFANGVAALKAKRGLEQLQKNDATREQLKAELLAKAEKVAPQLMAAAKNFLANSLPAKAKEKYRAVIEQFPGTKFAEDAQKELEQIQ